MVQYFKKAVGDTGRVIATDCSNLAPAVYDAFSLIDPELSLLAKEKEKFLAVGTTPVISPYELVETCFDKYKMYQMLCEMGIPTANCFVEKNAFKEALEKGEISFPVFAKPVKGSASINAV